MSETVRNYLFFDGCCEEAIAFYEEALGAETTVCMRYSDSPTPLPPGTVPEGFEQKIMHATLKVGNSSILAADGSGSDLRFRGFRLALTFESEDVVRRVFDALSRDGTVDMPLASTFWSPLYGMATDKYGVGWMLMIGT